MVNIIKQKELTSTNVYAAEQLKKSDPDEFTVYLAENQPEGKGQPGNCWESESGKNLTFSFILRPIFLPIPQQYLISKVVCLGIVKTLSTRIDGVKIKWPNDIYVDNKKICGILIENQLRGMRLSSSIVGVGLNVNQEHFVSDAPNPISMKQIVHADFNLDDVLGEILINIIAYYDLLQRKENIDSVNAEFLANMYRLGEWHLFRAANVTFEGRIDGVNKFGQLKLTHRETNFQQEYNFKEVQYVL